MIGTVSVTVALIGLAAACVTLLPRVTVTTSDPVDPNNPFSSSITITNSGYLPLRDVRASIGVKTIAATIGGHPNVTIHGDSSYGSHVIDSQTIPPRDLGLDDRFSFSLNQFGESPTYDFKFADIAIVVEFEIPLVHIKRKRIYPLYTQRESNGNFYWFADSPHSAN